MRQTILQGLEQAYSNLVHMITDFLPRFMVMLIIIVIGLLVAFLLKYILRAILRLTKLDRVSEEAGASRILQARTPAFDDSPAQPHHLLGNLVRLHFDRAERAWCCRPSGADFPPVPVSA